MQMSCAPDYPTRALACAILLRSGKKFGEEAGDHARDMESKSPRLSEHFASSRRARGNLALIASPLRTLAGAN